MPSIYDDPDVARTYSTNGPDAVLLISQLGAEDVELARTFFDGQAACYNSKFALADCLASLRYGVEAVDGFSAATPVGWKKNIVFEMTKPLDQLFYEHERRSEAQAFAEWMEQTIFQNGWHVDAADELTALGVRRQECTNIWMQVGMRRDSNGKYLGPSLEHARRFTAEARVVAWQARFSAHSLPHIDDALVAELVAVGESDYFDARDNPLAERHSLESKLKRAPADVVEDYVAKLADRVIAEDGWALFAASDIVM